MINENDFNKIKNNSKINIIEDFFKSNQDTAFKATEIANKLSIKITVVYVYLNILRKKGLLEHKSSYWKYKKVDVNE